MPPISQLSEEDTAARYAARLLADLGTVPRQPPAPPLQHPALAWARSGAMALTGPADGEALMCPAPLAAAADGALAALLSLAPDSALAELDAAQLLGERAAIAGLRRRGDTSPGGACRLLQAADGAIAVNLTRADDWALTPAWLEQQADDWDAVAAAVRRQPLATLVERARWLGLAVAPDEALPSATPWFRILAEGPRARPSRPPRVLDLSSLWAGPLCSQLLLRLGAEVVKFESSTRPDGARSGPSAFFDLLNAGKRCVAADPRTPAGRAQLRALIEAADIVIEASRPRALRQLGIVAEDVLAARPGLSWISLSGYGRGEPQEQWVAFGDDAGVAAGLSRLLHVASGERVFVGDAIADPLSGLHAALAAWASWLQGGGRLVSLALRDIVAHAAAFELPPTVAALCERQRHWSALVEGEPVNAPQARVPVRPAAALGADTAAVCAEWGRAPC